MEISTSVSVMECVYAIGEKGRNQKLYAALVTPGSSAGVKYRHGVALMSSFSRAMWVPLWVTGGRISPTSVLHHIYFLHAQRG